MNTPMSTVPSETDPVTTPPGTGASVEVAPVLLIEYSSTLAHVLRDRLEKNGISVVVARNYSSGLEEIRRLQDSHYSGVVLGLRPDAQHRAEELLAELAKPGNTRHKVLLISQDSNPLLKHWVTVRPNSAYLLWENYLRATDLLAHHDPIDHRDLHTPHAPVAESPIRVLLVDDSAPVRHHYSKILDEVGYIVTTASAMDEAMQVATEEPFDIAIIDYYMSGGNGDELVRRIKHDPRTHGIMCTILTGSYEESIIKNSLEAGAIECTFKNESNQLFLTRIHTLANMIRSQKSIESERQRLEGILGSVGDGVYGVDRSGMVTFMNPAARQILMLKASETVINRAAHHLFHYAHGDGSTIPPEDCPLQQAYASGERLIAWETVFWTGNRTAIPVECTVYPLQIMDRQVGSVIAFRDISDRRSLEQLRWQATHDPLTELINRRHFEEVLDNEINRLKRSKEHSALLYVDLDRFKFINDTAGHHAGDNLLIEVARKLKTRRRDADVLARLGGDEFTAILRNIDPENLYHVANSFREVLANNRFSYGGKTYKINASVGVSVLSPTTQSVNEALESANQACIMAKRKGRNQTYVYLASEDEQTLEAFATGWSSQLRQALQENRFTLLYQPIVPLEHIDLNQLPEADGDLWIELDSAGREASLFEVLLRMIGPENELIPPDAFIASAERFDLMQEIDLWVISNAINRMIEMDRAGQRINLTINLSTHTLEDESILGMLKDLLANSEINGERIVFEVTETSAITNMEAAKKFIGELKTFGCRFALDDFGSGFSTFSYLRSLPLDFVKIDGQFIRTMTRDSVDRAMVASMIDIGHSMGMKTVAEYVENPEVIRLLRECGVDYVQGHYIARPMDPTQGYGK